MGPYQVDWPVAARDVQRGGGVVTVTFTVVTPMPCPEIAGTVTEAIDALEERNARVSVGAAVSPDGTTWVLRLTKA